MKKFVLCLLALVTVFAFTACGGNDGDNNGGNNNGSDKNYTATVTPPAGWTVVAATYPLIQYGNDDADGFWIRKPTKGSDTAAEAASYKTTESKSTSVEFVWEAVKDVTVNTYAAKNLTYTATVSGIILKYAVYFVAHDGNIFIIVCQTQKSKYDGIKADFDAFLASFTIKEA